jgi:hypothetical protein
MPDLFLRPTIIAGERARDDYGVIWEGLPVGRIFKGVAVGGAQAWSWSCFLPNVPQPSSHRGRAGSLAEAKAKFQRAWADLQGQISHGEIEEARALAADRSRPWHRD